MQHSLAISALLMSFLTSTTAQALTPSELDFNRTGSALSDSQLPGHAFVGFEWQSDDANSLCWMPQGIAGIESGSQATLLVVSWYNDPIGREQLGAACGEQKGSRVSFIDTQGAQPVYRHVLLTDEAGDIVHGHAGGVEYVNGKLHVSNTNYVDVYDVNSITEVSEGFFGYRYVLQRESSYALDGNASFIAYDSSRDDLITGHFTSGDNANDQRLTWYSPDSIDAGQIINLTVKDSFVTEMQGAASQNGKLWISASYNYNKGRLSVANYSPEQGGAVELQTTSTVRAVEDLYIASNSEHIWTVTEFTPVQAAAVAISNGKIPDGTDKRIVFAIDKNRFVPNQSISAQTEGEQASPDIATDADGNTVVVWASDVNDNGKLQIFASAYDAQGQAYFADMLVSSASPNGHQNLPAVAMNDSGDFVVTWQDDSDGNNYYNIHARGFNLYGAERFPEFIANKTIKRHQYDPDVAIDNAGNFVVVWEDDYDGNRWYQIFGRGFKNDGSQLFAQRTINYTGKGQQYNPSVAMSEQGSFIATWQDDSNKNGSYEIYARGFNLSGSSIISEFTVNQYSSGDQRSPVIAMRDSGEFVVSWKNDSDGNNYYEVSARTFYASGSPSSDDTTINGVSDGNQTDPAIAMADNGDYLVSWEEDKDKNGSYEIKARSFSLSGAEIGREYTANIVSSGNQQGPAVALTSQGKAVIVWDDGKSIKSSRLTY